MGAERGILAGITCLLCVLMLSLRPQYGALLLAGGIAVWLGASYAFFLNGFFLPGITVAFLMLPAAFLTTPFTTTS